MNPLLASPRLNTVAGQDTELVFLEGLLEDDCKCESPHNYTPYCDGKASYRIGSCMPPYNSCKSGVDDPVTGMRTRIGRHTCRDCDKPAADCWTIRPI